MAIPRDERPKGLIAAEGDLTTWLEQEQLEMSRRERRRIGRDLHDGLGQELTGVALLMRGLAGQLERDAPQLLAPTNEIIALVNRAIEGARALARGLLPMTDEPGGLLAALRALADRGRALYDLDVQFRSEITPPLRLDENTAHHLYRIAQEALTNVVRHAQASRVEIVFRVVAGRYWLEIADDGIGLPTQVPASSGLGLGILRERAVQLGAQLEFVENSPRGTRVRVIGATQRQDG
jgi:signal transduction histidine kinase